MLEIGQTVYVGRNPEPWTILALFSETANLRNDESAYWGGVPIKNIRETKWFPPTIIPAPPVRALLAPSPSRREDMGHTCAICGILCSSKYCSADCRRTAGGNRKILFAENIEKETTNLPAFTLHPQYEKTKFILTDSNREAYVRLLEIIKSHIGDFSEESTQPVFGKVGFDVWASQDSLAEASEALSQCGVENPTRYIKIGKKSHHIKFNLCLPNSVSLIGLDDALQTNIIHPRRLSNGNDDKRVVQIGKRSLLEQVIRDGILPEEVQ